jgi:hypothetical protein
MLGPNSLSRSTENDWLIRLCRGTVRVAAVLKLVCCAPRLTGVDGEWYGLIHIRDIEACRCSPLLREPILNVRHARPSAAIYRRQVLRAWNGNNGVVVGRSDSLASVRCENRSVRYVVRWACEGCTESFDRHRNRMRCITRLHCR